MKDNGNLSDGHQGSDEQEHQTVEEAGTERIQEEFGDDVSAEDEDGSKPPFVLRVYRSIFRRRRLRREKRGKGKWTERIVALLTLTIIGTQAYIYWRQADIMRESLNQNERQIILGQGQLAVAARNTKTAEDTLKSSEVTTELDQRAWISARGAETLNPPDERIEIGKPFIARVTFVNTGKTPALNITSLGMHYLDRTPLPVSVEFAQALRFPKEYIGHWGSFPPSSGSSYGTFADHVITYNLPKADFEAIQNRTRHAFIEGKLTYCDVFGKQHWMTYCYHLLAGGAWQFCENNNDVDTDRKSNACKAVR